MAEIRRQSMAVSRLLAEVDIEYPKDQIPIAMLKAKNTLLILDFGFNRMISIPQKRYMNISEKNNMDSIDAAFTTIIPPRQGRLIIVTLKGRF